jgi:hypothetical protein
VRSAIVLVVLAIARGAHADPFADAATAAADCAPDKVDALIAALPSAPSPVDAASALFTTARRCQTEADAPERALALYDRIARDYPDAPAADGAATQARLLRGRIAPDGRGIDEARRFARLQRDSKLPIAVALAEATVLAAADWPGAGEALVLRADLLRRLYGFADALRAYDEAAARYPGTPLAARAREGAVTCAIALRDWDRAERLARGLPADDAGDRAVRDGFLRDIDTGRWRATWYAVAWIALGLALVALLASIVHAAGAPRAALRALRPSIEVVYAVPVVAILFGASLFSHLAIQPAIAIISGGGLVIAWLSGSALDAARRRGSAVRARALLHVAIAIVAAAALAYIAVAREGLLDMIIETVKFGPEI